MIPTVCRLCGWPKWAHEGPWDWFPEYHSGGVVENPVWVGENSFSCDLRSGAFHMIPTLIVAVLLALYAVRLWWRTQR